MTTTRRPSSDSTMSPGAGLDAHLPEDAQIVERELLDVARHRAPAVHRVGPIAPATSGYDSAT